jgi:hypothetical protein
MTNIGRQFAKLVNYNFINHRGFLLEISSGGYKIRGDYFENIEAVDKYINSLYAKLEIAIDRSVNRLKSNINEQQKSSSPESGNA